MEILAPKVLAKFIPPWLYSVIWDLLKMVDISFMNLILRRGCQGGTVQQPNGPPPHNLNNLFMEHLNRILYPGRIINCQALVPSPVPLDPNPKKSQIQVILGLGWHNNHMGHILTLF